MKAVEASSLLLLNDSTYTLTAVVQAANGIYLGQITIQPGEQTRWTQETSRTDLNVPMDSQVSMTPYIVTWKCPHEGIYSVCDNASPGSLIRANSCEGMRYCKPKKQIEENSEE